MGPSARVTEFQWAGFTSLLLLSSAQTEMLMRGQAEFPEALHVSNAQVKASIRLASLTVNIDLAGALQK